MERYLAIVSFTIIALLLVKWQIENKEQTGALPFVIFGVLVCLAIIVAAIVMEDFGVLYY